MGSVLKEGRVGLLQEKRKDKLERARRAQVKMKEHFRQKRASVLPVNEETLAVAEEEQQTREAGFRDGRVQLRPERSQGRPAKAAASMRILRLSQRESQDESPLRGGRSV